MKNNKYVPAENAPSQKNSDERWKNKTDQQLLDLAANAESPAIFFLVVRYQNLLLSRCRMLAKGNTDDAADLFSTVVIKIYSTRLDQFKKIRQLGGWLSQVTQNTYIDLQRTRQADVRRNKNMEYVQESRSQYQRSPEQELLNSELADQIRCALIALPARVRQAAVLRLLEDTSYEAIAKQLGISQVNARKRVQEARQQLASSLRTYASISSATINASPVAYHTEHEPLEGDPFISSDDTGYEMNNRGWRI